MVGALKKSWVDLAEEEVLTMHPSMSRGGEENLIVVVFSIDSMSLIETQPAVWPHCLQDNVPLECKDRCCARTR